MEVVRALNEAIDDCRSNISEAVRSVDEAVAYYTGSRTIEEGSDGVLLHALAEVRANQMNTRDPLDDDGLGDAVVNVDITRHFNLLADYLQDGNATLCEMAEESKVRIINLMKVPIVQSVIRSAYIQEMESSENQEGLIVEGATFAAAILPFVHECNETIAEIIHSNMKLGVVAKYKNVKMALETTYDCLGITCSDVGGVWDDVNSQYKSLPCNFTAETSSSTTVTGSLYVGIVVGIFLARFVVLG
jgi:hypothetical protein